MTTPQMTMPGGPGARFQGIRSTIAGTNAAPIYLVLLVVFLAAWVVVSLAGKPFLTFDNLTSMLIRSVALGIVAAGMTVVILAGSLDLSVAYSSASRRSSLR